MLKGNGVVVAANAGGLVGAVDADIRPLDGAIARATISIIQIPVVTLPVEEQSVPTDFGAPQCGSVELVPHTALHLCFHTPPSLM